MKYDVKRFFCFVIPSVLSFALSGVYAIVDGYFVGNSIGDAGLSAINIAYPIVAAFQALGTGIGMGGAVNYTINKAQGRAQEAKKYMAASYLLMILVSVLAAIIVSAFNASLLKALGAQGIILRYGIQYIAVIAIGAVLQIIATGVVPFIRNFGGAFYAMVAMIAGFISNIILDYLFVWVLNQGMSGAAWATVIGQGVTALMGLFYLLYHRHLTLRLSLSDFSRAMGPMIRVGIAPFGLTMSPNISLIIVNLFSVKYGGNQAVAVYAVIAYVVSVIYLILQGVGDGSQPLISQFYGQGDHASMRTTLHLAYGFALFLSFLSCVIMYILRAKLGVLFGSSALVNNEITKVLPIFLISVPFVAIIRVTTAYFYAADQNVFSYILTFIEPLLILCFCLILPPLFGGQIMVWWTIVLSRILSSVLSFVLKTYNEHLLRIQTV